MEKTFKTKEGAEFQLPMLPNYITCTAVLGMRLSKSMFVHVNELDEAAIRLMAKSWGEALIERRKTYKKR